MLIDITRLFANELSEKNCPIAFADLQGVRQVRVILNEKGQPLLVIDNLSYGFQKAEEAIAAAKLIADLVSESTEERENRIASLYAAKLGKILKNMAKDESND